MTNFSAPDLPSRVFSVEFPLGWIEISDLPFLAELSYCRCDVVIKMIFIRFGPLSFTAIMVIPKAPSTEPRSERIDELLVVRTILMIPAQELPFVPGHLMRYRMFGVNRSEER